MSVRAIRYFITHCAREDPATSVSGLLARIFLSPPPARLQMMGDLLSAKFFTPYGLELGLLNETLLDWPAIFRRVVDTTPFVDCATDQPLSPLLSDFLADATQEQSAAAAAGGEGPPAPSHGGFPRLRLGIRHSPLDIISGLIDADWGMNSPHTYFLRGLTCSKANRPTEALYYFQIASSLFGGPQHEPAFLCYSRSRAQFLLEMLQESSHSMLMCRIAWDFLETLSRLLTATNRVDPTFDQELRATRAILHILRQEGIFPRYIFPSLLQMEGSAKVDPVHIVIESDSYSIWSRGRSSFLIMRSSFEATDSYELVAKGNTNGSPSPFPSPSPSPSSSPPPTNNPKAGPSQTLRILTQNQIWLLESPCALDSFWSQIFEPSIRYPFYRPYLPIPRTLAILLRQLNILRMSFLTKIAEDASVLTSDFFALPHTSIAYDADSQEKLDAHLAKCISTSNINLLATEFKLLQDSKQVLSWLKSSYDNFSQRVAVFSCFASLSATPGMFSSLPFIHEENSLMKKLYK